MPTLAEINRESDRIRSLLQSGTILGETGQPIGSFRAPALATTGTGSAAGRGGSPLLDFTRSQINRQGRQAGGTQQGVGAGIPGVGAGTFGVEGPLRRSGPSRLLQSSGDVSRRFDTSGLTRQGSLRPTAGRVGGATGSVNVSQQRTDIQPQLEALLSQLIEQGGTPQSRVASGERASATQALQQTVQALTPAAAQAQAQGLVDNITRSVLDEVLPQLQAAGEGAGASRSALDQLQLNDVAARIGEKAAVATVEAITNFAGGQAAAGGVLERLTATDPISQELLTLLTRTPVEQTQSSGSVDILNALGLLPENLDPDTLSQLLSSNAPQFG